MAWRRVGELTAISLYVYSAVLSIASLYCCPYDMCLECLAGVGVLVAIASLSLSSHSPWIPLLSLLSSLLLAAHLLYPDATTALLFLSATGLLGFAGILEDKSSLGVAAAIGVLPVTTGIPLFSAGLMGLGVVAALELYRMHSLHRHQLVFPLGLVVAGFLGATGFELFSVIGYVASSIVVASLARTGYSVCPFRREEFLVKTGSYIVVLSALLCLLVPALDARYCIVLFSVGVLTAVTGFMAPSPRAQGAGTTLHS